MSAFRLLGPLEVESKTGGRANLGGVRPRRLLAALLVGRGSVLSTGQLVDAVWGDDPPSGAVVTLRSYVARVRRVLTDSCGAGELVTHSGGYSLVVPAGEVDADRFAELVADARAEATRGARAAAAEMFGTAVGLWRGDVLADLQDAEFARAYAVRMHDLRMAAWEGLYTARVAGDGAHEVIPELAELAVHYPFHEPFAVLLARAQYRSGRSTDALDTISGYRTRLRDDLGVDPGVQMRELEQSVLRQDPALDVPSPRPASAETELIERDEPARELAEAIDRAVRGRGGFIAVVGDAGIGKTSLVRSVTSVAAVRVLGGHCDHLSIPRPFGPLRDVAAVLGVAALGQGEAANITRVCEETLTALRIEPTVLVIEDVHWIDTATTEVLRFLLRRVADAPVAVVLTYREHEVGLRDPIRALLGELASAAGHTRIGLQPFSFEGVRRAIGGAALDPGHVLTLTGGNPYFVTRVCADPDRPLPATVRDTLLARMMHLADDDLQALQLAAISRAELSHAALRVLGVGPGTLEQLGATGMVIVDGSGIRFQHELGRIAVIDSIRAGVEPALHAALLDVLVSVGADPAHLTHHAVAAHDPARVVRYATAAGVDAARAGAHHDAAAFFEVALEYQVMTDDAGARATLLQQLAMEKYMTGCLDAALAASTESLELWNRSGNLSGLAVAYDFCALLEYFNANREIAERLVDEALAAAQRGGAHGELSSAQSTQGFLAYLRGDLPGALSSARCALEANERTSPAVRDPGVDRRSLRTARAEMVRTLATLASGDVSQRVAMLTQIAEARSHGWDELASTGYSQLAYLDVQHGRRTEALTVLKESLPFARHRDIPICGHWQTSQRARAAFERGDWDAALVDAAEVLDTEGMPVATLWPRLISVLVPVRRGQDADLTVLDVAWDLAIRIAEPTVRLSVLTACAEVMWTTGVPDPRVLAFAEDELRAVADGAGLGWAAGALAAWLARNGVGALHGRYGAEPFDLLAAADHRSAAQWWRDAGEPFNAALAAADSGAPADLSAALRILHELGAEGTAGRYAADRSLSESIR